MLLWKVLCLKNTRRMYLEIIVASILVNPDIFQLYIRLIFVVGI